MVVMRVKRFPTVLAALAFVLSGCDRRAAAPAARATEQQWQPGFRVELPPGATRDLLTDCSGNRMRADSLWTPSSAVIANLEERLAEHLRSSSTRSLKDYSLQYFGFWRGGRREIFVNGVHNTYLARWLTIDTTGSGQTRKARVERSFRTLAINVCDGGEGFFRAEYDVASGSISTFAFNHREG